MKPRTRSMVSGIHIPTVVLVVLVMTACDDGQGAEETTTIQSPTLTEFAPPTKAPTPTETPTTTQTATTERAGLELEGLGAPVLAYGPYDHSALVLADRDGQQVIWPGPVDIALPDDHGGLLVQPATEQAVVWFPDIEDEAQVRLVTVDGSLLLRGFLADGRVLYSVRPHPDTVTETSLEEFFAIELAEGSQPELVATSQAYESSTIGPAVVASGELIHASCHLHCSLWPGLADAQADAEPLYHGGGAEAGPSAAIEGLVATPDGQVVAFVEYDIILPEQDQPELVLLDGGSFEELARIELPLDSEDIFGHPTVSLSADGQHVLVTLGSVATEQEPPSVPTSPHLVQGALTDEPQVQRIDNEGALRWFDPVAATIPG